MTKHFNITGVCVPGKHYMVDISNKINEILKMVDQGNYFVINRPRQYGKTTTLDMLDRRLQTSQEYLPIQISFEDIGEESFANSAAFSAAFFSILRKVFKKSAQKDLSDFIDASPIPVRMDLLGDFIEELVKKTGKKIVLLVDEVDKNSNNQLFLDFLGMLRHKFLNRDDEGELTFHSVILAGVHDVKNLKLKIGPDAEIIHNSPWNIATEFEVDLSFSTHEITSMLEQYAAERQISMDIPVIAAKLFYYTSGYPFLVSQLCKIIDEKIIPTKQVIAWTTTDVDQAVQIALNKNNTNVESLVKNLENNPKLYDLVFDMVMNEYVISYNPYNKLIALGVLYGIFREENARTRIHNRIYEQIIYNYMASNQNMAR